MGDFGALRQSVGIGARTHVGLITTVTMRSEAWASNFGGA